VKLRPYLGSLAMVALALGLGVYAVVDHGTITDAERKDREHDVFPAYRRSEIDWLEIVQGGTKLRIERRSEKGDAGDTYWQMTSPADERADPAAVDRFIGDLEFAGVLRRVDASKAAPEVNKGFDAPRVTGTLSMKPLVYHFALGGPAPVPDGAAYFRVDGEGTFVISKDFVTSLLNGADTYRERSIIPYLSLDLAELAITSSTGTLGVKRVDEISFKLSSSGLRASRDGMDKLWGALAAARAESFLSDADAERALGPNPVRVLMTPRAMGKPKGELLLGGVCPGHPDDVVLVRVSPTREAACVPKVAKEGLSLPESALVDPRLFASRADEVEELTLETLGSGVPPFTVELARKGRGWHERKPNDRELAGTEIDVMNDLVTKLTRGDALTVESSAAATRGPFVPRSRARLRRASTGVEEVVELEGTDRVRRVFDGAELRVPDSLGRRLVPSEIAFRARSLFGAAIEHHMPIALRTHCDGVRQSLAYEGAGWRMHEPAGYAADPLATADLVGLIQNAQAESWVADRDDGSFGFAESTCGVDLDVTADGGKTTLGIVFGKETDGGFYAHTTADGAVFLAPRALRDGALVWLIDRGGFHADPSAIVRVTLSRGPAHVELSPHAHADGGPSDRTSRAFEALALLRPEVVVHLGPPKPDEGFATPTLDVRVKLAVDGGPHEVHFMLGDTALLNRERMVYARVEGVDATYAVARERVGPIIEGL